MTYKKMNKNIKKQWLKSLRSGEYEQVGGFLYCDGGYCCLGVLFEATQDDWWVYDRPHIAKVRGARKVVGDVYRTPESKSHLFGRDILGMPAVEKLAKMNDSGKSFDYIADWIEKNL